MVVRASRDQLDPKTRAEDILLGSLGYGEEARLRMVMPTSQGYRGTIEWRDGSHEEFESTDELTDLHRWALSLLTVQ